MDLLLRRYSDDGRSTAGLLFLKDGDRLRFLCHTLEDEHRDEKVKGETRIRSGFYALGIKREDTPLTLKSRKSYGPWFKYFIELLGVANFSHVYVHAGNTDAHTDGCLLLGRTATSVPGVGQSVGASVLATQEFYSLVYPVLERGDKVHLAIEDEDSY